MKEEWLIWSIEHNGWWGPDRNGYKSDILKAGQYNYEDAVNIVTNSNVGCGNTPYEAIVPVSSMLFVRKIED